MATDITEKVKVVWKPGSRHKIPAQDAFQRLEELRKRDGNFTAATVLDDGRSSLSPLHDEFEWDDTIAAEEHRLQQARLLICSVAIVREPVGSEEATIVRAFVVVNENEDQHYTSLAVALSDDAMRRQVVLRALNELEALQRKYHDIEELKAVFEAADVLRNSTKGKVA